jgi:hypothetical protein
MARAVVDKQMVATEEALSRPCDADGSENGAGESSGSASSLQEYLCYFYHRHLDYRIPEIEALAQLAGEHTWRFPNARDLYTALYSIRFILWVLRSSGSSGVL